MSTMTAEAPPRAVRGLHSVKADFAEALGNKSKINAAKDMMFWLPKKVAALAQRAARFAHLDTAYFWVADKVLAGANIIGRNNSVTLAVTSKTGQRFIGWVLSTGYGLGKWGLKTAYSTLTWPLRQIRPTRIVLETVETAVGNVAKSGPVQRAKGWITTAGIGASWLVHHDRPWIAAINATAFIIALVRLTRHFVRHPLLRVLAAAVELPAIMSKIATIVGLNGRLGRWLNSDATKSAEESLVDAGEAVVAEAAATTAEAADKLADKVDAEVIAMEEERIRLQKIDQELASEIDVRNETATRLREQAEDMRAAESAIGTLVEDRPEGEVITDIPDVTTTPVTDSTNGSTPKPGPTVPPMHGPQSRKPQKGGGNHGGRRGGGRS